MEARESDEDGAAHRMSLLQTWHEEKLPQDADSVLGSARAARERPDSALRLPDGSRSKEHYGWTPDDTASPAPSTLPADRSHIHTTSASAVPEGPPRAQMAGARTAGGAEGAPGAPVRGRSEKKLAGSLTSASANLLAWWYESALFIRVGWACVFTILLVTILFALWVASTCSEDCKDCENQADSGPNLLQTALANLSAKDGAERNEELIVVMCAYAEEE